MTGKTRAAIRAGLVLALSSGAVAAADEVADRVMDELQGARAAAGLPAFERRAELDAVALERARAVAALSHAERLTYNAPIGDRLDAAHVRPYASASAHVDMVRGYKRPENGFIKSWNEHRNEWHNVLDREYTAAGAASLRADDGFVVLVCVFVADMNVPDDPRPIELAILDAVNALRSREGLASLVEVPELSAVARRHSEDMLRRNFVAHVNPDGDDVAVRVERAGFDNYSKVGENIHMSRGAKDPAAFAVEQWMGSTSHRNTMLDPSYRRTGVGVVVAEDGSLYFTQLFLSADRPR